MKYTIFLLFFINVIVIKAQTELADYSILYNFKYITDTTLHTYSEPEHYILYKVNDESYFINRNTFYYDSLSKDFEKKMGPKFYNDPKKLKIFNQEILSRSKKAISNFRLLKNFDTQSANIILTNSARRKYMEVPMDLAWNILSETDSVFSLLCKKATTHYGGRNYTAWFTEEIPIADGPYMFQGLPGLIIKIVDDDLWYEFKVSTMILKPHQRYVHPYFIYEHFQEKLSREEYIQLSVEMKENPKLPPGMLNVTPEMKLNLKEKYKKRFDLLLEKE